MLGIRSIAAIAAILSLSGAAHAADGPAAVFQAGKDMGSRTSLSVLREAAKSDGAFGVVHQEFKGGDLFTPPVISDARIVSKDISTLTISGGKAALDSTAGFKTSK